MSEGNIWKSIKGALGGDRAPGRATTVESLCDAGLHQVDPNWKKRGKPCPYCEAATTASRRTADVPRPAGEDSHTAGTGRRSTKVDDHDGNAAQDDFNQAPNAGANMADQGSGRRHTKVDDAGPESGSSAARSSGGGRRIQGILSTFTWNASGDLFILRDGRNFVGSGNVSFENNAPCEVQIKSDPRLSSAHFLILFQNGRPLISDNLSMNGTMVNGALIDGRGIELTDDAEIKAGDTVFVYQRVRRSEAKGATGGRAASQEPFEPDPDRAGGTPRRPTSVG